MISSFFFLIFLFCHSFVSSFLVIICIFFVFLLHLPFNKKKQWQALFCSLFFSEILIYNFDFSFARSFGTNTWCRRTVKESYHVIMGQILKILFALFAYDLGVSRCERIYAPKEMEEFFTELDKPSKL